MKISQLKQNIKTVITSLIKLQMHRDNITQNPNSFSNEIAQIAFCKETLEEAFSFINSQSLNKFVDQIRKRKTKRHRKKLKTKLKRTQPKDMKNSRQNNPSVSFPLVPEKPTISLLKKCQLRSSKKYLATISCLETLHQLRGGGDSCRLEESLNSIKSIWQSPELCIRDELKNASLEKCWDDVLFGKKSEIAMGSDLGEFLEKRFVWDSYVDNANGSHIPIGWILPKEDASSKWKQYLQLS